MIKRILFLGLFCLLPVTVFAQNQPPNDDREADRTAIREHIEGIFRAYINKDRKTVQATHSEDWRGFLIGTQHIIRGIDEYMQAADSSLKNPTAGMAKFSFPEFDVIFQGPNLALVCYVADIEGKVGDTPFTDKYRTLDVYARRNGAWIQIASNTARHPEAIAKNFSQPVPVTPQTRQSILDAREEVWRAWFSNDQAKLEKLIPPEVIAINGGSETWANRDQILASARQLAAKGTKLIRLEFPRTDLQIFGRTIILYTTYVYETETDGKRTTVSGRGTEMFVIRDNTLVNVGWHLETDGQELDKSQGSAVEKEKPTQ